MLRGRHAQHLLDLEKKAERVGLVHFLVQDAEKNAVSTITLKTLNPNIRCTSHLLANVDSGQCTLYVLFTLSFMTCITAETMQRAGENTFLGD